MTQTAAAESARVLVIDDDPSVTASLTLLLMQRGYRPLAAHGPDEAIERLRAEPCDVVIQDMNFGRSTSGEDGLELVAKLRALAPETPVILITAWGSISLAVRGVKAGAFDFLTKPWDNERLLAVVETALQLAGPAPDPAERPSRDDLDERYDFHAIVGSDPALIRLLETIGRVCATDASVLILGESGTGKELVAEALHRNGRRCDAPFVKVNLGGISTSLFESEMFGHVRGAFTDATSDRPGRFALAEGGTIFLDEIGDLEPASQVKLLRVLQDRSYEVLGSSATRRVDVRVVSATNRDLAEAVQQRSFREDLLYRLNLITVRLPPLRERRGDVPALANHFLRRAAAAYGADAASIDDEAVSWLRGLDWPGNIRQFQQTIDRAVLMSGRRHLRREDFVDPELIGDTPRAPRDLPVPGDMTLDQIEKAMIEKSLAHYGHNLSRTAQSLGISRAALYRRLEKYGIRV